MIVALHVVEAEAQLGALVQLLPVQNIANDTKSINGRYDVAEVTVLHRLNLIDVERYYFEHFLLDSSHVHKRAIIHHIEAIIVCHNITVIGLIFPDLIDTSHLLVSRAFLWIGILCLFILSRDLLPVDGLAERRVELGNDRARRVNDVAHLVLVAETIYVNHLVEDQVIDISGTSHRNGTARSRRLKSCAGGLAGQLSNAGTRAQFARLIFVFYVIKFSNDLFFHGPDVVNIAHDAVASTELPQVKRDALLNRTEAVEGV